MAGSRARADLSLHDGQPGQKHPVVRMGGAFAVIPPPLMGKPATPPQPPKPEAKSPARPVELKGEAVIMGDVAFTPDK